MASINLAIVVPIYNEAEVIEAFNARLMKVLRQIEDVNYKVVYVVDKCTDNTLDLLRAIVANDESIKILCLTSRFGHQASLFAGIEDSLSSDAIIMMDGDLQHPPELIPELINKYKSGYEVVYTTRVSTENINQLRKIAGNLFYKFLSKIAEFQVNPNAADFRLISKRVAIALSESFRERKLFLRGLFSWMGFDSIGVEYQAGIRMAGTSKYSFRKMIELATVAILSFSIKPLQIGIVIGLGSALLSFLLMIYLLGAYFLHESTPSGWMTLIIALLLIGGIQLIVIGIVGAYVGGIYEEVKGRPRYLIDQIYSSNKPPGSRS